ncbi:MAG: response regulator [Gammaproteobacteria bacterium]|nr:response regulator [Gammaproteobacteria bacterium]
MAKILLVDDDDVLRFGLLKLLQSAGYQVLEASNGLKVPLILAIERPDLMICDIIMPEREGIETIIDARQKYPKLRIIAMSVDDVYLGAAEGLGANAVMRKKFNTESWQELLDMIELQLSF